MDTIDGFVMVLTATTIVVLGSFQSLHPLEIIKGKHAIDLEAKTVETAEKLHKESTRNKKTNSKRMQTEGKGKARNSANDAVSAPHVKSSITDVCVWPLWADPNTSAKSFTYKYIQHIGVCCWMCACVIKIICNTKCRSIVTSEN